MQKDSCFELGQVRYVLQGAQKCSCGDTTRQQKKLIGTVSVRMFDWWSTKLHISNVRRYSFGNNKHTFVGGIVCLYEVKRELKRIYINGLVYYETIKRDLSKRLLYECPCDERLKAKTERDCDG